MSRKTIPRAPSFSWDYLRERFKWAMRAGYIYSDLAYDYFTKRQETVLSDITHSRSYANTFYGQLEAEYMPSSRWMLSAQASVYRNGVKSSDNSPYHAGDNYDEGRWEFSACLSARWKPAERFAVAACLREEVYGGKGVPPIPALFWDVVLSKRWNIVAKGSIARNYRCPSLDDLYFRPGGNPDLKTGARFHLRRGHRVEEDRETILGAGECHRFRLVYRRLDSVGAQHERLLAAVQREKGA